MSHESKYLIELITLAEKKGLTKYDIAKLADDLTNNYPIHEIDKKDSKIPADDPFFYLLLEKVKEF